MIAGASVRTSDRHPIRGPLMSRRLAAAAMMVALASVLTATGFGCAAKESTTAPPAAAGTTVAAPGAAAVVEPGAASSTDAQAKETCHGALDCTFFGLGAVLATPFWLVGALLGLVF